MKMFVDRDTFGVSNKRKIELDSDEWTTLIMALRKYREWMEERGWHLDGEEDSGFKLHERTVKALKDLDISNIYDWKTRRREND